MSSIPQTTHIYALIDPRDGQIRYIGKANNTDLRLRNHVKEARKGHPDHKSRWIRVLLREGYYPALRILEVCSASEWKERESWWIADYRERGYRLTNHKDGGDGNEPDEETRERMSAAKRGKPPHNKGKQTSDEAKAKQSAAANRRWARMTEDERRAYTQPAQAGRKPISEETREKLRAAARERERKKAIRSNKLWQTSFL